MAAIEPQMLPARRGPGLGILFVCFFLSGATGLVYEVVWLRMLGLIFGHTVYAITTVLAAFMAGLALGSFLFARLAGRIRNLVRAYGWLEIGIGLCCAAIPVLLWLASLLYLGLHRALGFSHSAFSLVQFLIVFTVLLVPTTLMGGTLPVLSQALAHRARQPGRTVGALYAVNTFGAVLGVALAGYLVIPAVGNRVTIAIAAVANLAVGTLALAYSRRAGTVEPDTGPAVAPGAPEAAAPAAPGEPAPAEAAVEPARAAPLATWLTVAALGVSGAVSMVYEVAWTRALALVIGSSTYAFTSMLVAFLVGIAGGSALYSWLWGRRRASAAAFGVIQAGIGVTVALTVLGFERSPVLFLAALRWSDSPGFVQLTQVVVSASVLLLSTLLIGATFPCAVAVATRGAGWIGRDVGHVYAVNTLGAIAGTLLGGFVLMPAIGAHATIKLGIATNLLLAAILSVAPAPSPVLRRWSVAAVAVAAGGGVLFIPPWDLTVLSSGPAIYAKLYLQAGGMAGVAATLRGRKLLFYRDGLSSTVSVHQDGEHISLRNNGKTDAGTGLDVATQLMLGHLPMLIHPAPRTALVIGLGSGMTAGAVARHPIQRLDVVEIEPAIVEASRFFAQEHGRVLEDARVRLTIADGRNFLLTSPRTYDVIISEPSNPWIGGLASLFSVEFFEIARQHLAPGGIMVQWLQGYNLVPDDLRMVVRTFRSAFPATSVWNTLGSDYLLVGRREATPLDLGRIKALYETSPGLRQDLNRLGVRRWSGVLGFFMLAEGDTPRLATGAGLNTDDRLPLEFSAPRALYLDTMRQNLQLVRGFKAAELPPVTADSRGELDRPEVRHGIGAGYLSRNMLEDALPHFQRALQLDEGYVPAMVPAGGLYLRLGRPRDALRVARQLLARQPRDPTALLLAGLASEALGARPDAVALLEQAFSLDPQNPRIRAALDRARGLGPLVPPPGSDADTATWLISR